MLSVLALILYSPVIRAPFLYDDVVILGDSRLHAKGVGEVLSVFTERGLPRRVTHATFAANHVLDGLHPAGYRVVSAGLHVISGLLVLSLGLWICQRMALPWTMAAAASLLWFIHPVHTQAVAYAYQRFTLLAAVLYLGGLRASLAALDTEGRARAAFGTAAVVLFILALGAKENTATLPLATILLAWLFGSRGRTLARRRLLLLLGLAVAAVIVVAAVFLGPNFGAMIARDSARRGYTPLERVMTEWRVVVHYVTLLVWPSPSRLRLVYDWPLSTGLLTPSTTVLSLGALLSAAVWAVAASRRRPLASAAILWFLLHLAIESSFVPLDLVYEHRLYLPSVVPVLAVVAAAAAQLPRRAALIAFCLVAAVLGAWTSERVRTWSDPVAFFEDNVRKAPGSGRVRANLARAYLENGRPDDARREWEASLRADPAQRGIRTSAAALAIHAGDVVRAEELLEEETRSHPDYAPGHLNRGVLRASQGRHAEALAALRRALELEPRNPEAIYACVATLLNLGRAEEALALAEAPGVGDIPDARLHAVRGLARLQSGDPRGARQSFEEALRLDPRQRLALEWIARTNSVE